ncbi:hypothetical protein K439DRAFT_1658331 [Ramaria rubella]|nr:hypothetical protein K439DRAFT_1658331 [Ramaria rubella]
MSSLELSASSIPCQRPSRSRSSSVTESTSPESTSSDSHSSSDPDTHLLSLSPWLQTPGTIGIKAASRMDVDVTSNPQLMDLDSEMYLDHHDGFQLEGCNFDDLVAGRSASDVKSDMLMLEEIIRDGAFDPASNSIPTLTPHSTRTPLFCEFIGAPSLSFFHESQPQPQQYPVCIDPSSTQAQSQPFPAAEQLLEPADATLISKAQTADVPVLSPDTQSVENETSKPEPPEPIEFFSTLQPYDTHPRIKMSSTVVYPPKDACSCLPILFPSIPLTGTKSRVETQIKLIFELGIPISDSSSSPNSPPLPVASLSSQPLFSSGSNSSDASPVLISRALSPAQDGSPQRPTHDKVGTYKALRLPPGTVTKRKSANSASAKRELKACDISMQDTLQLAADVMCCSSPHTLVQSCSSCQSREAKRTARKLAARVRPLPSARHKLKPKPSGKRSVKKAKDEDSDISDILDLEMEENGEEPNVDGSILQFNCAEFMDLSNGTVILPMRITCYCRHHKEKVGFKRVPSHLIVFTLRDHMGRVVGQGITPPILITDDHKSTSAVSKLPPMHPLRQSFNLPTPPSTIPSPTDSTEEIPLPSAHEQSNIAPTKRRDLDLAGNKKRRPKPYDGRPSNRTVGLGPGIEGRQGVVLALHPAHARLQVTQQLAPSAGASISAASTPPKVASSPETRSPTPSCPEMPFTSSQALNGPVTPQTDLHIRDFNSTAALPHSSSPSAAGSFNMFSSSSPSSLPRAHQMSPDLQTQLNLQANSQAHLDSNIFPIHPLLSFVSNVSALPKIHRLIPSSGPTAGGIEITVLGSNFHELSSLECVFGGAVASSTHRWSDNTLVCVLPPRATPGVVNVEFKGPKPAGGQEEGGTCLFNYVDESDRQLMELALQVVGLKMTGKIEEARNVAMRIVGNTNSQTSMTTGELTQMGILSETSFVHHSFLGSLSGMDLETLVIKLLTLLDVPLEDGVGFVPSTLQTIDHQNATGQTLLHLAVLLALPSLVSCLVGRSIDIDARNNNGMTALHLAAFTGWKEGVEILLAEGADVSIIDGMGMTPAQRTQSGHFEELNTLLHVQASSQENDHERESGEDGDDEAWHTESEESGGGESDVSAPSWSVTPPQYIARPRMSSSTHLDSSPDEFSACEDTQEKPAPSSQMMKSENPLVSSGEMIEEKPALHEKQDASFVERLQRTLPHGILPNVQIPGFPQIQLPGMLAAPWGALPQIPVFPVFVPIPNLPHPRNWSAFPWSDALSGEKKESRTDEDATAGKQPQQPSLAMLWTAYDSFANSAWRAQWEKWTAQVTALQNANNRGADLPPYSPRSEEKQIETLVTPPILDEPSSSDASATNKLPETSTSGVTPKITRRVGYSAAKVSKTEVDSYHYRPKKAINKQDRMLVLFWIPILFLGLAYAVYTILPVAITGISRAAKRMLPQPLQRGAIRV